MVSFAFCTDFVTKQEPNLCAPVLYKDSISSCNVRNSLLSLELYSKEHSTGIPTLWILYLISSCLEFVTSFDYETLGFSSKFSLQFCDSPSSNKRRFLLILFKIRNSFDFQKLKLPNRFLERNFCYAIWRNLSNLNRWIEIQFIYAKNCQRTFIFNRKITKRKFSIWKRKKEIIYVDLWLFEIFSRPNFEKSNSHWHRPEQRDVIGPAVPVHSFECVMPWPCSATDKSKMRSSQNLI